MVKVNAFLAARFKKATQKLSKMAHLVEMSSKGNLSSFTGVFRVNHLSAKAKEALHALLEEYKHDSDKIEEDVSALSDITAEVKAINSQALLLHGERIKRAQTLFKSGWGKRRMALTGIGVYPCERLFTSSPLPREAGEGPAKPGVREHG